MIFSSCSSDAEKSDKKPAVVEKQISTFENFQQGTVIDNVTCKTDTSQSYAMYIPKSYDSKKAFPVIYAFDPHKTGRLPVALYKDLCEKYGYIIIGSNNSENGLDFKQVQPMASVMFNDSKERLNINPERIYLMGFSGGARIAHAITILNHNIKGVICCGAANPAVNAGEARNNYSFFGIAGLDDFNYTEMKKYDLVELSARKLKHYFISFDGKHEWPSPEIMQEAFNWQDLNEKRKDPSSKNDPQIIKQLSEEKQKLGDLISKQKDYETYLLCKKVINYYDQLGDLSIFFSTYNNLKTSQEVNIQLKLVESEIVKEEKLRQEYIGYLQNNDLNWWQKEIASMNRSIKGKNNSETQIKKRLLSYLSLVCYMQTSSAIKQNDLNAADHFGKLYILIDPENSEAHYLMAEINAKKGNKSAAVSSLENAVKFGFTDKNRAENNSAFEVIKNEKDFVKLMEGF